jgi:2-oxoglutarate/2-oxoacid ferredoxin oxidoreductase subunit beta
MAKARKIPAMIDKASSFCPGCGHGIAIRLIAESLEELGKSDSIIIALVWQNQQARHTGMKILLL